VDRRGRDAGSAVAGFCGVTQNKRTTVLESLYVAPDHPAHAATVQALVDAAVQRFGHDRDLHTTIRHAPVPARASAGFATVSALTNFTKMVRPATIRGPARATATR
jgi:hypothetical protein